MLGLAIPECASVGPQTFGSELLDRNVRRLKKTGAQGRNRTADTMIFSLRGGHPKGFYPVAVKPSDPVSTNAPGGGAKCSLSLNGAFSSTWSGAADA
jgi:hypothetical protein